MQWVAHDRLGDENIQKALIHHGANRQSLYQYYHRNRSKARSANKIATPQDWQARAKARQPSSQLIQNLVSKKTMANPGLPQQLDQVQSVYSLSQ